MPKINESEQKIQKHVINIFKEKLNYKYLGFLKDQINTNIMYDKLIDWLTSSKGGNYSEQFACRAIEELIKVTNNLENGLYTANQSVYSLLKYGLKLSETPGSVVKTIFFIDWDYTHNNVFGIAEEVTIRDKKTRRPDLVIYINGIAVAVIELKKSVISVSNGIRQNRSNQSEHFNKPFFSTMQFIMAGNNSEGLRYGAIGTNEKDYLEWKNDTENTNTQPLDDVSIEILEECKSLRDKLDWQIYSMFHKTRFLDLLHNFVIFDKGEKKLCRYNQFFGVKKAQIKLNKKQGGIIWHTQGSGKTLTMVWLSKWILAGNPNARILIVTDREGLDRQVERVYKGVNEDIYRTKSCNDLIDKLSRADKRSICTLIHKFGLRPNTDDYEIQAKRTIEQFIKDLKLALPTGFQAKGIFYIFVDECHRTQSGLLHEAMKEILPEAIFIGFTGTPLLAKDKKTSIEVFTPGYIHTYKYDQAVADGVVLDLKYEARDIDQVITSQDRIDEYFEIKTRALNTSEKAKLKSKWASLQKIYSSRNRLEQIAKDIIADFDVKPQFRLETGNAILVAQSIYDACRYFEIFKTLGFNKCAIITSFDPNNNISGEDLQEFEKKKEVYDNMLNGIKKEDFEEEAERKFIYEPAQMKLLIVVDKLLTGFDAPPCTYLYIDKEMKDHGLFQAICRVNRLYENKDFGYLVDYKLLFGKLSNAVTKYTSDIFAGYDEEDIIGVIKNRLVEAKNYLDSILRDLDDLCSGVPHPFEEIDYIHYFCGKDGVGGIDDEFCSRMREKLYMLASRLLKSFVEIKGEMTEAGYTISEQEYIEKRITFYTCLKATIGNASGDFIDLKAYEPDMRRLIDSYIRAEEAEKIGEFDDFTLLKFILSKSNEIDNENNEAVAETIENNIRRKIIEKRHINPKYFENMSVILDELIKERKKGVLSTKQAIEMYKTACVNIENPENNLRYPEAIRHSEALRSFYDNLGEDERLALNLYNTIKTKLQADFRHHPQKERRLRQILDDILQSDEDVEMIYQIVVELREF